VLDTPGAPPYFGAASAGVAGPLDDLKVMDAMAQDGGRREFDEFDARLRKARTDARLDEPPRAERPSVGGTGIQVGVELIAGVVGGGLIGYGLDRWLETWPVLLILFFFLGSGAGMLNAYRHIRRASEFDGPGRG
jgi:ATP synthase protein I